MYVCTCSHLCLEQDRQAGFTGRVAVSWFGGQGTNCVFGAMGNTAIAWKLWAVGQQLPSFCLLCAWDCWDQPHMVLMSTCSEGKEKVQCIATKCSGSEERALNEHIKELSLVVYQEDNWDGLNMSHRDLCGKMILMILSTRECSVLAGKGREEPVV